MIPIEKTCPICGNNFIPTGNAQKYCSPRCARQRETTQRLPYIKERQKGRQTIDKNLLFAYNCECAICHWSIPEWKDGYKKHEPMHGLHYHHIVPVSDGGSGNTDNIILLCPNCHKMAHAGLISDDELRKHTYTKEQCERIDL